MLYTELIRLWDEAVRAVDAQDLHRALASLNLITEPTSRTLFVTAAVHLSLRQIDLAIKALDQVIAKDERLAVGFFQRAAVHMMANRLEEALRDCMWAQKYMRDNAVIDYKQLGLRYKLYSWQVLYNAAAVYCRMNQWEKAEQTLLSASQERGGRGSQMDSAMSNIARREVIVPLMVPEGLVFRPRKQDVEELHPRDFLGKAEVIISDIPNDDFGGFEPLRLQKPGYYEPKVEEGQFMNSQDLLSHRLCPLQSLPHGIPLPPSLKPPTRPQTVTSSPPDLAPPSPSTTQPSSAGLQQAQQPTSPIANPAQQTKGAGSAILKVHYRYTIALSVPLDTPYHELQERIAQKLGQPSAFIRLRHKQHGSPVLRPLEGDGRVEGLAKVVESGRATLWCQPEDPLAGRTILYQMVALYNYVPQGPEDLEFSEGDTIDVLSE
ncbi:hypothetical protein P4O66_012186, partial [Electrophorus voltai]